MFFICLNFFHCFFNFFEIHVQFLREKTSVVQRRRFEILGNFPHGFTRQRAVMNRRTLKILRKNLSV